MWWFVVGDLETQGYPAKHDTLLDTNIGRSNDAIGRGITTLPNRIF